MYYQLNPKSRSMMIPDQSFAVLTWNQVQEIFTMGGFLSWLDECELK